MRTNRSNRKPSAVALALVAALVLGGQPAARADAGESQQGGPSEGIKVHGDWTIEIRNPDGSLASRHEFKNALVPGQGDAILAETLGRTLPAFTWVVDVGEASGLGLGGPCVPPTTPPNGIPCSVSEPGLTVAVGGGTVQLSGTVTAQQSASVARVATRILVPATVPRLFTEKQLSPSIPVLQGQIIQVKVVFSFS